MGREGRSSKQCQQTRTAVGSTLFPSGPQDSFGTSGSDGVGLRSSTRERVPTAVREPIPSSPPAVARSPCPPPSSRTLQEQLSCPCRLTWEGREPFIAETPDLPSGFSAFQASQGFDRENLAVPYLVVATPVGTNQGRADSGRCTNCSSIASSAGSLFRSPGVRSDGLATGSAARLERGQREAYESEGSSCLFLAGNAPPYSISIRRADSRKRKCSFLSESEHHFPGGSDRGPRSPQGQNRRPWNDLSQLR